MELFGLLILCVPLAILSASVILVRCSMSTNDSKPCFRNYAILSTGLGLLLLTPVFVPILAIGALAFTLYIVWIPVSLMAMYAASDRLALLPKSFIGLSLISFFLGQLADPGTEASPILSTAFLLILLLLIVGGIIFAKAYDFEKKLLREWNSRFDDSTR